jgi:methyl-accepting chemotaxis protein
MMNLFSGFKKNSNAANAIDTISIALDGAIVSGELNLEQFNGDPSLKDLAEKIATFVANKKSATEGEIGATLKDMIVVCDRASRGDMEARLLEIDPKSSAAPLQNAINRLIDVSDAFSRDVGASLESVSHGIYYRRIFEDGLEGEFVRYAKNVNTAIEQMGKKTVDFRAMTNQFAENIRSVAADATDMSAPVEQLAGTAASTSIECGEASGRAEDALQHVQAVAAAADEMVASIEEIDRQVQSSNSLVGQVATDAEETNITVGQLSTAAGKIEQVMHLIQDIAEKTNLLALNATIEAARAGEAGRGFAVVASEVKGLASQTAKATDDIGGQIKDIQRTVQGTVDAIKGMSTKIEQISEMSNAVAATITEQNSVVAEISRSAHGAAESTQEVAQTIASVSTGAASTGSAAEQLRATTEGLAKRSAALITEVDAFLLRI